jgi:hypothetical protein
VYGGIKVFTSWWLGYKEKERRNRGVPISINFLPLGATY